MCVAPGRDWSVGFWIRRDAWPGHDSSFGFCDDVSLGAFGFLSFGRARAPHASSSDSRARAFVQFYSIRLHECDDGDRGDDDDDDDDDWRGAGGVGETRDVDGGDWDRWVRARASCV